MTTGWVMLAWTTATVVSLAHTRQWGLWTVVLACLMTAMWVADRVEAKEPPEPR